ncbi:MAG: Uncharacterised protein [Prochlorococcus marinus str. MIT 9215]|nr:MAG: Uncharacterised protein [Prochlorococcus marinus str. MIT 9215]
MPSPSTPRQRRKLHPLPKGLVELYGLIAVLVVLIPEWLAEGTLNMDISNGEKQLPLRTRAWQTLPELRLAAMNMKDLRQLARHLKVWGYASESRDQLSKRLLRRLKRRMPKQKNKARNKQRNPL